MGLLSKRWGLGGLAGALLAITTLCCSSFSASAPPSVEDASAGLDGNPVDAMTAGDGGDAGGDGSPPDKQTCATLGDAGVYFCEDFEGKTFPPTTLQPQGSIGELDGVLDPTAEGAAVGNHVFRARGVAGTLFDKYLDADLDLPPSFEARFQIRAGNGKSFDATAYVMAVKLECGAGRAFGVVFDSRGLSFQFDDNDGDFEGFAKDARWHPVIVKIADAESSVTFEDGIEHRVPRSFTARSCTLRIGAYGFGTLPNVELDFDNVSIRGIP